MVHFRMFRPLILPRLAAFCFAGAALLAGCGSIPNAMPGLDRPVPFSPADFDNTGMYTRHVLASQSKTCEAARRALLSQGYLVNTATDELVTGRKYFQPTNDIHYQVEMRVVCATEGKNDEKTAAYASALQDRYVIKKINNSASLGVGALGSVSLPVSATDDTLVKVGSETVSDPRFYELFFQLFDRYVPTATPQADTPRSRDGKTPAPVSPSAEAGPESREPQADVQTHPVMTSHVQAHEAAPALPGGQNAAAQTTLSSIDMVISQLMAEQPTSAAKDEAADETASPPQQARPSMPPSSN